MSREPRPPLVAVEHLRALRSEHRAERLVLATGCFDLLHAGHVLFLESAAALGDFLVVGVNGDASVESIKGLGRPVVALADRLDMVGAVRWVDAVFAFDETDASRWIRALQPDYFATNEASIREYPGELEAAHSVGCAVVAVDREGGPSTSAIVEALKRELRS